MGLSRASVVTACLVLICGCPEAATLPLQDVDAETSPDAASDGLDGSVADEGWPDVEPPPSEGRVVVVAETFLARPGHPVAGLQVVFHAPDGSVLTTTVTDARGRAEATVPRDGMLTLIDEAKDWRAFTITGLQPPETVRWPYGLRRDIQPVVTTEVVFPSSLGGSNSLDNGSAARSTSTAKAALEFFEEQLANGRTGSVLAIASPGDSRGPQGFSYLTDVAVSDGQRLILPAWRTDWTDIRFNWRGPREASSSTSLQGWVGRDDLTFELARPERRESQSSWFFDVRTPTDFSEWYAFRLTEAADESQRVFVKTQPTLVEAIDFDAEQDNLPYVNSVELLQGAAGRPVIRYVGTDAATHSDQVLAAFAYLTTTGPRHFWSVVGRPGARGTVGLPQLPPPMVGHLPTQIVGGYVEFTDDSRWEGYADARRNAKVSRVNYQRRTSRLRLD